MNRYTITAQGVPITEIQGTKEWPSQYRYVGPLNGLYLFQDQDGKCELFARRSSPYAGWNLRRGAYFYEFCRSA